MSISEEDHARMMKKFAGMGGPELNLRLKGPSMGVTEQAGGRNNYEIIDGNIRFMANQKLQAVSADALAKQKVAYTGVRTDNKRKGQHQPKKDRNKKGKSR